MFEGSFTYTGWLEQNPGVFFLSSHVELDLGPHLSELCQESESTHCAKWQIFRS